MSLTDERIQELWTNHVINWKLTGKTLINPIVFARAIEAEATKPQEPIAWKGLTDVQWMNIVNHDNCYLNQDKEDAVHLAVKLTEARLKGNNATPQPCLTATDSGLYTEAYVTELRAKCAELEAEDSAVQLLKDSTINQQAERIKELEAERDEYRTNAANLHSEWSELLAERDALNKLSQQSNQDHLDRAIQREKERLTAFEQIDSLKDEVTLLQRIAGEDQAEIDALKSDRDALKAELPAVKYTLEAINTLKQERDALAMKVAKLMEFAEFIWRDVHLNDYGHEKLSEVLVLPDTSEIIKRHDAALIRDKAIEFHCRAKKGAVKGVQIEQGEINACMYAESQLREMALELEKSCSA